LSNLMPLIKVDPIDGLGSATIASAYVSDHALAPATSIASATGYGYATVDSATDDRTATGLDFYG
jgi:hypothetical protein